MSPARAAKHRRAPAAKAPAAAAVAAPKHKRMRTSASSALNYDVYDAGDQDQVARKLLARRGGGGGEIGRTLDNVGALELGTDVIDDEDDEEIDEDEAFDDSDEERFGMFFQNKSTKRTNSAVKGRGASRSQQKDSSVKLDLDEGYSGDDDNRMPAGSNDNGHDGEDNSDDDEEEEEDGEYMDLSEMLGASSTAISNAKQDASSSSKSTKDKKSSAEKRSSGVSSLLPDELESMSDSDGNDDDDDDSDDNDDDDMNLSGDDGDDLGKLAEFVRGLDGQHARKRKRLPEITEALGESEFGLAPLDAAMHGGRQSARAKVALEDLVGAVGDERGFGQLKKQVETFDRNAAKQAVAAPLPKRLEDRLNRQAAYEESKKEVSLWTEIVKKNRESDRLVFPANERPRENLSSSALVDKFEPVTDLEKEIQSMLVQSGLIEKKQRQAEELELNRISKEEVATRQKELARMRALMFYEEQKQKKISKIKSKTYRKIRKKESMKINDLSVKELANLDPDLARRESERLEFERVKERMTLKHKNTGKWAKNMFGRHDDTGETRQAISEQLRRHEELRRKISGIDSDDSDASDADQDAHLAGINELDEIEKEVEEQEVPAKGLFAMKFMQRNLERQKQATLEALQNAREELENSDLDASDDNNDTADENRKSVRKSTKAGESSAIVGRAVHGASGKKRGKMQAAKAGVDDNDVDQDPSPNSVDDMDGNAYSVRASGPVTITLPSKGIRRSVTPAAAPTLKPLFAVERFDVEDGDDQTVFTGKVSIAPASMPQPAPQEQVEETQPKTLSTVNITQTVKRDAHKANGGDKPRVVDTRDATQSKDDQDGDDDEETSNPWLSAASGMSLTKKSTKGVGAGSRDVGQQERALAKLSRQLKQVRKNGGDGDGEFDDEDHHARLEGLDEVAATSTHQVPSTSTKTDTAHVDMPTIDDSDDDSDMGEIAPTAGPDGKQRPPITMVHKLHAKAFSQIDLMRMAFASDDVVADFEAEKQRVMQDDAPKADTQAELPGWGSWSGPGVRTDQPARRKKNNTKSATTAKTTTTTTTGKSKKTDGVDPQTRRDANLKHVIINEKRNAKALKYMLPQVPHGFETAEQYERMTRMPVGREWNTQTGQRRLVAPRVQTQLGAVIHPLTFKTVSSKTEEKQKQPKKRL